MFLCEPARALESDEQPQQREWAYQIYADADTGESYPAAVLMSRVPVESAAKAPGIGYGYLAVGNYLERPMEVTLAWDDPPSPPKSATCKPGGCELTMRLGTAGPLRLIAFQQLNSPSMVLQDGRAFLEAAGRHAGAMDVQVQTLRYGSVTLRFSTADRLQVESSKRPSASAGTSRSESVAAPASRASLRLANDIGICCRAAMATWASMRRAHSTKMELRLNAAAGVSAFLSELTENDLS